MVIEICVPYGVLHTWARLAAISVAQRPLRKAKEGMSRESHYQWNTAGRVRGRVSAGAPLRAKGSIELLVVKPRLFLCFFRTNGGVIASHRQTERMKERKKGVKEEEERQ